MPKRVCLLGSGALHIGQAGKFHYSGAQALKALREEGVYFIPDNLNIATVQTDPREANRIYLTPLTPDAVGGLIGRRTCRCNPAGFGGLIGLSTGSSWTRGACSAISVCVFWEMLTSSIRDTEDRQLFAKRLQEISIRTPFGVACRSYDEGIDAARKIGFPLMLRAGFASVARGSGVVDKSDRFAELLRVNAFAVGYFLRYRLRSACLDGRKSSTKFSEIASTTASLSAIWRTWTR